MQQSLFARVGRGICVGMLGSLVACSGGASSAGPAGNTTPPAPTTGAIRVTTTATGQSFDPDGYDVRLDGNLAGSVVSVGTLLLTGLTPGAHAILVSGATINCTLSGASQSVTVRAGDTTAVAISAACLRQLRNELAYSTIDFALAAPFPTGGVIATRRADGTGAYPVSADLNFSGFPSISPTGTRIAFVQGNGILVRNADGTGQTKVFSDVTMVISWPRWSPDGTALAFLAYVGNGQLSVYRVNIDGTSLRRLSPGVPNVNFDGSVDWSPDGKTILFVRNENSLMAMDTSGANAHAIIPIDPAVHWYSASYSRDGQSIAAVRAPDTNIGKRDIYLLSAAGTNVRQISFFVLGPALDRPAWSPDGTEIAIGGNYSGIGMILIFKADGSGSRTLIPNTISSGAPDWSPIR